MAQMIPISPRYLTRSHLVVLLTIWGVFMIVMFLLSHSAADKNQHMQTVVMTTLLSITGPMTGGLVRGQGCCIEFGFMLLPVCGGFLAAGFIPQVTTWTVYHISLRSRLVIWGVGLFFWLAGGPISLLHAFG